MYYKEISKIKELVDEYHWIGDDLLVIVRYPDVPEFAEIIKDCFEFEHIYNVILYEQGNIGVDIFQDVLEHYDVDPKDVFPEEY